MSSPAQAPSATALPKKPPQSAKAPGSGNFTKVPNYLIDDLMPSLTHAEFNMLILVCRRTSGWADPEGQGRVKEAPVPDGVWTAQTGLGAREKRRVIQSLDAKQMLNINGRGKFALFSLVDEKTYKNNIRPKIADGSFPPPYTVGYVPIAAGGQHKIHPKKTDLPVDSFCLENGCERRSKREGGGEASSAAKPEPLQQICLGPIGTPEPRRLAASRRAGPGPVATKGHEQERLTRIRKIGNRTIGAALGGRAMPEGFELRVSDALPTASLDHLESLCKSKVDSGYRITGWRVMLLLCGDAEQVGAQDAFEVAREAHEAGGKPAPKKGLQKYAEEQRRKNAATLPHS